MSQIWILLIRTGNQIGISLLKAINLAEKLWWSDGLETDSKVINQVYINWSRLLLNILVKLAISNWWEEKWCITEYDYWVEILTVG